MRSGTSSTLVRPSKASTSNAPNGLLQPTRGRIEDSRGDQAADQFRSVDSSDLQEMSEQFPGDEFERQTAIPEQADIEDRAAASELQPFSDEATEDEIFAEIEDEFPLISIEDQALPEQEEFPPQREVRSLRGTPVRAQRAVYDDDQGSALANKLVSSPKDLKPLSDIQPYYDYEPDAEVREKDPYLNIFPRPDDAPAQGNTTYPEVVGLGEDLYQQRNLAHVDYPWLASDLYHRPLYFEDVDFERYGHTHHALVQPFVSLGKFGLQCVGLPYQMALQPVWQRQYALGWYRPGEVAPYKYYQVPWNTDAAVRTGVFYTGMSFAFP